MARHGRRGARGPPGCASTAGRELVVAVAAAGTRARRRSAGSGPGRRTCRTRSRTAARRAAAGRPWPPGARIAGSCRSSSVSVRPGRNSDADALPGAVVHHRRPDPGLAPRPRVLRCSASRSIPSSSEPGPGMRTTTVAVGVVTLRLRLVSPPGRSTTVRGRCAVTGMESSSATIAGSSPGSSPGRRRGSPRPPLLPDPSRQVRLRRRSRAATIYRGRVADARSDAARPRPHRDHRRRGGRRQRRPPPRRARRARRAARRARRAHQRLDVPLRRAGRPAARRPGADPDERPSRQRCTGGWRRPAATARRAGSASGSLRLASSPAAAGGDPPAGGWAQRAGPAAGADLGAGGGRAVPADVHRRRARARRTRPTDGQVDPARLCYALAASARAGGRDDRAAHPGHGDRPRHDGPGARACAPTAATSSARSSSTAAACSPPRSPAWSACGCRSCRCRTSTWSPRRSCRPGTAPAAVAARPRPARLLPPGGRRAGHGRLRAAQRAVDRDGRARSTPCPPTSTAGCCAAGLGPVRRDRRERPGPGARAGRRRRRAR